MPVDYALAAIQTGVAAGIAWGFWFVVFWISNQFDSVHDCKTMFIFALGMTFGAFASSGNGITYAPFNMLMCVFFIFEWVRRAHKTNTTAWNYRPWMSSGGL